jgi:hypothetical protein
MKLLFSISVVVAVFFITGDCYAADNKVISVSAVVLSKSQCKFDSKTATLNLGNLDPASPSDKSISTSMTFQCKGSAPIATFSITDDDGLYELGPNAHRMRHTTVTSEYLPYSLTLSPGSGTVPRNTTQTLMITATVMGDDYQDALAGNYSDIVVLSINP